MAISNKTKVISLFVVLLIIIAGTLISLNNLNRLSSGLEGLSGGLITAATVAEDDDCDNYKVLDFDFTGKEKISVKVGYSKPVSVKINGARAEPNEFSLEEGEIKIVDLSSLENGLVRAEFCFKE